eukprot:tig00021015_g17176.t1
MFRYLHHPAAATPVPAHAPPPGGPGPRLAQSNSQPLRSEVEAAVEPLQCRVAGLEALLAAAAEREAGLAAALGLLQARLVMGPNPELELIGKGKITSPREREVERRAAEGKKAALEARLALAEAELEAEAAGQPPSNSNSSRSGQGLTAAALDRALNRLTARPQTRMKEP